MYRIGIEHLREWRKSKVRKPLIIRGARQVGKTYLVRQFGKEFDNFVEINFERDPDVCGIFSGSLSPAQIIKRITALTGQTINENTLLFFDEIQQCPRAITALRYFYEERSEIKIIAAGSLLEFALEKESVPVGRVEFMYMYPMNFKEFVIAKGKKDFIDYLEDYDIEKGKFDELYYKVLYDIYLEYMAVGGMPAAVKVFLETSDYSNVRKLHNDFVETYFRDIAKYAKKTDIAYSDVLFHQIPRFLGEKFVFAKVDEKIKARELRKGLDLLIKSGIVYPIYHSSCSGIPLSSQVKYDRFKLIFFDIGLAQSIMNEPVKWMINDINEMINKGGIVENFVGQEIISYKFTNQLPQLYYWAREKRGSMAEVDYVIVKDNSIIPIEVKGGKKRRSNSINIFIDEKNSPYGILLTNSNFEIRGKIKVFPIFGVIKLV